MPAAEADTTELGCSGTLRHVNKIHFGDRANARKAIFDEYFILTYGKLLRSAKTDKVFLPSFLLSPALFHIEDYVSKGIYFELPGLLLIRVHDPCSCFPTALQKSPTKL